MKTPTVGTIFKEVLPNTYWKITKVEGEQLKLKGHSELSKAKAELGNSTASVSVADYNSLLKDGSIVIIEKETINWKARLTPVGTKKNG